MAGESPTIEFCCPLRLRKGRPNPIANTQNRSAFVVSIVRQAYVSKVGSTADSTWDNMPAALVSVAELMAGFLAASIPTYRPLFRHFFPQGDKNTTAFPAQEYGSSGKHSSRGWSNGSKLRTKVSTGAGNMSNFGGISVTRDIELSTHHMAASRQGDSWMRVSDDGSEGALRAGMQPEYYR